MLITLRYHLGTYEGEISVNASEDDDNATIIARARRQLFRRSGGAPLGLYAESWKIVSREEP